MKKVKKFVAVAAATVMTMSLSLTAFGASLSPSESVVIKDLRDSGIPSTYTDQVRNYLLTEGVDVTSEQFDVIDRKISAASLIVDKAGSFDNLTAADLQAIMNYAKDAGSILNVTVKYDAANGSVSAISADGKEIFSYQGDVIKKESSQVTPATDNADAQVTTTADSTSASTSTASTSAASTSKNGVIKATGASSMSTTYAVIAVLAMSLAGCGVVASKKRTADEE